MFRPLPIQHYSSTCYNRRLGLGVGGWEKVAEECWRCKSACHWGLKFPSVIFWACPQRTHCLCLTPLTSKTRSIHTLSVLFLLLQLLLPCPSRVACRLGTPRKHCLRTCCLLTDTSHEPYSDSRSVYLRACRQRPHPQEQGSPLPKG